MRCGASCARSGSPLKKSLRATEQDRPDVARRRERWKRHQHRVDPGRLVFVDETWAKTNMTRTHGRALRGQRLVASVPHARWTTMTFVAALRSDGLVAPCVFDGAINGCLLLAWVTQFLVPTLRHGDIVVLDNLGSHKGVAVRRAIRDARCAPVVPAALQSGPEPDRDGLRQTQDPAPQSRRTLRRCRLAPHRSTAPTVQPSRMRKL